MSPKGGTRQMESVQLKINEHMTSVGEEILCVLDKPLGNDVCSVTLNVRVFMLERLSAVGEFMYNLFQREMETLDTLLEKQDKRLEMILQPHIRLYRAEVSSEYDEAMSPMSPVQEDPEPPQIKEEQEEAVVSTLASSHCRHRKTMCYTLPESETLPARLQPGQRRGRILVHDGFRYQRNKTRSNKIFWRCWRKTCGVFMQTSAFNMDEDDPDITILHVPDHNHENDGDVIATTAILHRMTRAMETDQVAKPIKRTRRSKTRVRAAGPHSYTGSVKARLQPGKGRGRILVHDGYRYQRNLTRGTKIFWRCWRKTCAVFMQTSAFNMDEDDPEITMLHVPEHNHENDGDVISASDIVQRMTRVIETDPTKSLKRVYDEVVGDAASETYIPGYRSVRSVLARKRALLLSSTTQSVDDVGVVEWAAAWDGTELLVQSE